jgi:hypothetical protein
VCRGAEKYSAEKKSFHFDLLFDLIKLWNQASCCGAPQAVCEYTLTRAPEIACPCAFWRLKSSRPYVCADAAVPNANTSSAIIFIASLSHSKMWQ